MGLGLAAIISLDRAKLVASLATSRAQGVPVDGSAFQCDDRVAVQQDDKLGRGFLEALICSSRISPGGFVAQALASVCVGKRSKEVARLSVAAVVCVEIGLIYATVAKDAKTLYTMIKTLNIFILRPLIYG